MGERRPMVSLSDLHKHSGNAERADIVKGLVCKNCGCRDFRTHKTIPREGGYVSRRKICRHCGNRVTTSERIVG